MYRTSVFQIKQTGNDRLRLSGKIILPNLTIEGTYTLLSISDDDNSNIALELRFLKGGTTTVMIISEPQFRGPKSPKGDFLQKFANRQIEPKSPKGDFLRKKEVEVPRKKYSNFVVSIGPDQVILEIADQSISVNTPFQSLEGKFQVRVLESEGVRLSGLRIRKEKSNRDTAIQQVKNELGHHIMDELVKIKNTDKRPRQREGYCILDLSEADGGSGKKNGCRVYLTPEISYEVKKDNSDLKKGKNVGNKYNLSDMANSNTKEFCISNPLTSLRAFICDIFVKNLILFGLLVLFITLFAGDIAAAVNQRLLISGIIVLIYNLVHWIFKTLENIFVWACQYSTSVDELVEDGDQWLKPSCD